MPKVVVAPRRQSVQGAHSRRADASLSDDTSLSEDSSAVLDTDEGQGLHELQVSSAGDAAAKLGGETTPETHPPTPVLCQPPLSESQEHDAMDTTSGDTSSLPLGDANGPLETRGAILESQGEQWGLQGSAGEEVRQRKEGAGKEGEGGTQRSPGTREGYTRGTPPPSTATVSEGESRGRVGDTSKAKSGAQGHTRDAGAVQGRPRRHAPRLSALMPLIPDVATCHPDLLPSPEWSAYFPKAFRAFREVQYSYCSTQYSSCEVLPCGVSPYPRMPES